MKKEEFKLPKRIILLGEIFTIKEGKLKNFSAEIRYNEKEIVFDIECLKRSGFDLEEVLWHELAHYFFRYYDIPAQEALAEGFSKYVKRLIEQLGYKNVKKN